MRGFVVAWVSVAVLAVAGCGDRTAAGSAVPPALSASPSASATAVELACAHPAEVASRLLPVAPPGPAASAIRGDRVTTTFQLEGRFTAAPPAPGYTPAVSAAAAACQLTSLYATNGSGSGPGRLALATVTINGTGITRTEQLALNSGTAAHIDVRPPATYSHRPAWILVTAANNAVSAGCPTAQPSNPAPPSGIEAAPYEVFVLDATTGADAVLFEDSYILCPGFAATPPSVSLP
ncbi:MAG: hypothetical protein QOI76_3734, partial [Frankiales bacterium]|nr:hypothetical protein [Frankiales bacterium]